MHFAPFVSFNLRRGTASVWDFDPMFWNRSVCLSNSRNGYESGRLSVTGLGLTPYRGGAHLSQGGWQRRSVVRRLLPGQAGFGKEGLEGQWLHKVRKDCS
jgi:hypothetical protein